MRITLWYSSVTVQIDNNKNFSFSFWATVCKTDRPMLSDCCLSVLSCPVCLSVCPLCNVGVLWPNVWMGQDETWPRPWPHCVRWGPSFPPKRGIASPQFSDHVYCGQTVRWIKMALGIEVGLGPGHIVLDGDPAPLPQFSAQV